MLLLLSFVSYRRIRRHRRITKDPSSSTLVDQAEAGSVQWWTPEHRYVYLLEMRLTLLASIRGACIDFMHHIGASLTNLPSGVSRSTPSVSFFASDVDNELWYARASVFNIVNTSTNSLGELVAGSRVVGQLAGAVNHDGYLSSINTAFTAHDMLRIIKAYGTDKIQYWGLS